jgi:hypothetical protein
MKLPWIKRQQKIRDFYRKRATIKDFNVVFLLGIKMSYIYMLLEMLYSKEIYKI